MKKTRLSKLVAEVKRRKDIIAFQRDKLRDIADELETELSSFDQCIEDLESAILTLSQIV